MVITQSIGAQLISRAPKLEFIRYHGIELRTKGVILRRRLIDLPLLHSPPHSQPLLHQNKDQIDSIVFLIEWIRCIPC